LASNTTGGGNTAVGVNALQHSTGSFNLALGQNAGLFLQNGDTNVLIANAGVTSESNTTRIGTEGNQTRTFISGIQGVKTGNSDAVAVVIDSNGQLGTINSSARYKEDIQDMGDASSRVLDLRPVTYRYKEPYADGSKPIDYGLIAEEVAKVFPDLVVRNAKGEIETVQYQKLTPMLLNELQKEHRSVEALQEQVDRLQQAIELLLSTRMEQQPIR